jgi:hypothetical protein
MSFSHVPIAFSFVTLSALVANASASVIPAASTGPYAGTLVTSASVNTPNPGNDNVPGLSTNTLTYAGSFSTVSAGGVGFSVANGPATEYSVTLSITNNTGTQWSQYELYSGAGNILQPAYTGWFVFDYDLAPTISGAGTSAATWSGANAANTITNDNWLTFSNLSIPAGATIQMTFNLDLPVNASGGWAVQQLPLAVPTPASAALLGLGSLLTLRRRRVK